MIGLAIVATRATISNARLRRFMLFAPSDYAHRYERGVTEPASSYGAQVLFVKDCRSGQAATRRARPLHRPKGVGGPSEVMHGRIMSGGGRW